jgi:hypothetical protein
MRINDSALNRLAENVVRGLLKGGFVTAKVPEQKLAARVVKVIIDNLRAEEEIEREAERIAEKLGRQALGMDQRKIIDGIKARIAKERGFTL